MMRSTLVAPPSVEPVSVAEAKVQAVIEHDEHDDMVSRLIMAARQEAEQLTGRALITQTWQQRGSTHGGAVELRRWPALEVVSVSDNRGELPASEWAAQLGESPVVEPVDRFEGVVTVVYKAGYGAEPEAVPAPIRQWILATAASLYEHRERAVTGTITAKHDFLDGLLDTYVVQPV
ncbi:head-tail connector protein [Vreelandella sp.]|uniref:head-tail connector protein n=1 Tax=Vreelandella sp. TaxID=3137778 RepID=UPI003BAD7A06